MKIRPKNNGSPVNLVCAKALECASLLAVIKPLLIKGDRMTKAEFEVVATALDNAEKSLREADRSTFDIRYPEMANRAAVVPVKGGDS